MPVNKQSQPIQTRQLDIILTSDWIRQSSVDIYKLTANLRYPVYGRQDVIADCILTARAVDQIIVPLLTRPEKLAMKLRYITSKFSTITSNYKVNICVKN